MSDHTDHGNVFAVMLVIGALVLFPALYGLLSGAFTN